MQLQAYLDRIGYAGPVRADFETLARIHKHHLLNIPYENIDVQFGRTVSLDIEPVFDKIVNRCRGGWCYEMNGLLAWALEEIGFSVQKLSGGVMRETRGDAALGNHLVLLVNISGTQYLTDVGYGDGLFEPVPLTPGLIVQRGLQMELQQIDDGYWRFRNHMFGAAPSFDFNLLPAQTRLLQRQCDRLQTDADSPFKLALVCQTFTADGIEVQLGRLSKSINRNGVVTVLLDSPEQLITRLEQVFGIDEPEIRNLWPAIVARHEEFLNDDVPSQSASTC
ncbi:MAG: arylamine N-acetyltransferase [bacterium]|nr:arylamine N-acetyltransferase [Gammaproteobacteria bacterium]